MQNIPVISIVGRPNVGKSTLFNRILRRRIAVVDDTPGVTRDRNYMQTTWNGFDFNIVDTGGLIPNSNNTISNEIRKQVNIAVNESSAIIFLVEAQPGPTYLDMLISDHLKKLCPEKIVLAVNKTESQYAETDAANHISLGCGEPLLISSLHGKGIGDLLSSVCRVAKKNCINKKVSKDDIVLSIAVTGRPNSGKSSFVNKLTNSERMIVEATPGTTRDAVDTILKYNEIKIKLIDTAGMRKKSHIHDDIEYFSTKRALSAIKRCDVCILLVDTIRLIGEQDLRILRYASKLKKGIVVCLNKWDIVKKESKTFDNLTAEMRREYNELQYVPIISMSALTGQRVSSAIDSALQVKQRMIKRVKTSELRDNFSIWVKEHPHPYISSKEIRFFGIKQLMHEYPYFAIFCGNHAYVISSYKKYLYNKLQDTFNFSGSPVVLGFRPAGKSGKRKEHISDLETCKEV